MDQVLLECAPGRGEAAVLSVLAVDTVDDRVVGAGSLITVPEVAAEGSWRSWGELQPATRPHMARNEPDLGASFSEEPFPGIHIHRSIIRSPAWQGLAEQLEARHLEVEGGPFCLRGSEWGASKLFTQHGETDAHGVLWEVQRPVRGVALRAEAPEMPSAEGLWVRGTATFKPAGQRTREELRGTETFANWPLHLLGIQWPGTDDTTPPKAFVIGRAQNRAWIADVVPDEGDLLGIVVAWDAAEIDPFSCSVLVRSEIDSTPLLVRHLKISDLPGELVQRQGETEARDLPWNQRTVSVRVPRGPRGTCWGVSLIGPDGQLLDERPVVRRIERTELSVGIIGEEKSATTSIMGDRRPPPTEPERDTAVLAAAKVQAEAAAQAARRRISTAGELESYLRWRFSARAGELLVLDPYLLAGKPETVERVFGFLLGLRRPIRALTARQPESGLAALCDRGAPHIAVRGLPNGKATLHDRLWLVGETGVLVGTSLNDFLKEENAASTAVDLPFADAAAWRDKFENWWARGKPLAEAGDVRSRRTA